MSTISAAPAQMPHRRRSVLRAFSHSRNCSSNDIILTSTTPNELPSLPQTDRASKPHHSRTSSSSSIASTAVSPTTGTFASLTSPTSSIFSFRSTSNPASPTSASFSFRAARNSIASLSSAISASSGAGGRKASLVGEAVRKLGPSSSNPDVEALQPPMSVSAVAAVGPRGYVPRRAKSGFMASVTPLAERVEV